MRIFTVRKGRYAGEHKIYDSIEEAQSNGIEPKSPWYRRDIEIGDWCVSDDGYVLQLLFKHKLINKNHRSGQYTEYFRFCNGTFYVYYGKQGKRSIKNFYGAIAASHKSSLGNTSSLGQYMTLKKKHFVSLLASGLDPYNAYITAYKSTIKFTKSTSYIWIQINKLLADPVVRSALTEQLKPLIQDLQDEIRKETGLENMQEWLVSELTSLLVKSKKLSPKDKRDNIRLVVALFGEPLGLISPKKQSREIEDAEWQLVPPPALITNTEINNGNNHTELGNHSVGDNNNSDSIGGNSLGEKSPET